MGGFAGLGIGGNTFSGNLLWNTATGNPALATTLTLNNLPVHDSISLSFLLAIIDSWDSDNGPGGVAPDYLFIKVDGVQLFQGTWANGSGSDNTTIGTDIGSGAQQRFNNGTFPDRAYDATGDGTITDIAHSASTLAIQWFAGGAGWQGGSDENFGLDNLRITVNTAADALPEPITLGLFGFGLASLGLARRRRS